MTKKEKLTLTIAGVITLLFCAVVSWYFMAKTDQGLTYWASTIGTAVGGIFAVIVAVALWRADARAGRRQSRIDSNAKSVEVILNNTRQIESILRENDVFEQIDLNPTVTKAVSDLASEITSAAIWIRDENIRAELLEVTKYFSANNIFRQHGPDINYKVRIYQICTWLQALCEDLLQLEHNRGELKHRAEYKSAWQKVEDFYAEQAKTQDEYYAQLSRNEAGETAKQRKISSSAEGSDS